MKGKGKGVDDVAALELDEWFAAAAENGKKAIAVVSKTDEMKDKKRQFHVKDEIVTTGVAKETPEAVEEAKKWLSSSVGWTCNKGKKPEQCNQDCLSIFLVDEDFALYGIYDGHGPEGHYVSEYAARILPNHFLRLVRNEGWEPGKAFTTSFLETQKQIQAMSDSKQSFDAQMSGSTCTMAYHCMKSNKLTLAHVGDSRSIMGSADGKICEPLTIDHKPDLPKEKQRIESADPPGRVIFDGFFNHRVFAKTGMYPGLNMSRALGDCVAHAQAGLTAEPDILEVDLSSDEKGGAGDRVLILCTDGVWEFIENEQALAEALTGAKGVGTLHKGISALAKLGYDRWLQDSDNEISDDITGIMVRIPFREAAET